jgi:COPII coat assembly protein SEC16
MAVEETESSEYLKLPHEEDGLDMEGGPTPRVSASAAGRSDYVEAGQSGIEHAYPPMEQDEILESMTLANEPVSQAAPPASADPYATLQRTSSLTYAPPNMSTISPYSNTAEPPASVPKPPSSAPKAIPPPGANPYAPSNVTSPPQPPPSNGLTPSSSFRDAYAPPHTSNASHLPPQSMSTLAAINPNPVIDLSYSPPSTRNISSYNPYNPATGNLSRKSTASESDHGYAQPYGTPAYGYTPAPAPMTSAPDAFVGAQYAAASLPPAQNNTAYAPSPSLLGTNDPLGRASVRVPIFSFGFGGRVVACFHNNPGMGAFDGMAPVRPSTMLTVKTLKDFIPPSAYDVTLSAFPGPLFGDQGAGGATSVLQSAGAATKAKKAAIVTWLDGMIKEAEGGFIYAGAASGMPAESAKAEGKLVLMRLLKVWIENDGKLSGRYDIVDSEQFDLY